MRMYAASLSDYNAGRLHGEWIGLEGKDVEDIDAEVTAMLASSREPIAEEWAAHDWEGIDPSLFGEYPDLDRLVQYVEWIEDSMADDERTAKQAYVSICGDLEDAIETFEDAYAGTYDSPREWAYDDIESSGVLIDVPESIVNYFDYEAYVRDADYGGVTFAATYDGRMGHDVGECHVFYPV